MNEHRQQQLTALYDAVARIKFTTGIASDRAQLEDLDKVVMQVHALIQAMLADMERRWHEDPQP